MPGPSELLATLAAAAGDDAVREATPADAIDGVQPAAVVEPRAADAVARVLAAASARSLSVVVRGGGTKLGWGRTPARIDVVLGTHRLSRVLTHAAGDLTAVVESGVPLSALNRELGAHRQWLPLESAFESATIGGLLATNDAGPLRHRFGTPRDLLIGVHLATPDGNLARAGGNVVKNVAGYDLGRLVAGSFGSLAVIVSATFKLTPIAPATGTRRFVFDDPAAAVAAAHGLAASQLDPIALDIHARADGTEVLVRFASTASVVGAEMAKAERLVARLQPRVAAAGADAADEPWWATYVSGLWQGPGAVLKVSWPPASLEGVVAFVADVRRAGAQAELAARAGIGTGLLRIDAALSTQIDIITRLRERSDVFERAAVLRAGRAVKAAVDVWGDGGETEPLLAAIKRAFDPAGILNAGRGPV